MSNLRAHTVWVPFRHETEDKEGALSIVRAALSKAGLIDFVDWDKVKVDIG